MALSCEPNDLAQLAKCFQCLSQGQRDAIHTYLLCTLAAGGAAGAMLTGPDADPNGHVVPNNPDGAAFYYQDPATDLYSLWKWDIDNQVWVQMSGV
jgi:hypothetical protein